MLPGTRLGGKGSRTPKIKRLLTFPKSGIAMHHLSNPNCAHRRRLSPSRTGSVSVANPFSIRSAMLKLINRALCLERTPKKATDLLLHLGGVSSSVRSGYISLVFLTSEPRALDPPIEAQASFWVESESARSEENCISIGRSGLMAVGSNG
jgi:hypothetical protein